MWVVDMKQKITIALSGNPNAGKTTVFNAITGAHQHIANYPGVTVEKKYGTVIHKGREIEVVDLPGTYSLTAYSLEELVARNFVIDERPDLVVDIVDASSLDRHLYLAVQFKELGVPLVIALNMMDTAESRGIIIDAEALSSQFGAPVVPMVARSNKGIQDLLDKVVALADEKPRWEAAPISYGMDIDHAISKISEIIEASRIYDKKYPSWWRALKCLEMDSQITDLLNRDPELGQEIKAICEDIYKHTMSTLEEEPEAIIADHRYGYIAGITKKVVKRKIESRINLSDKIDKVLTNRIIGPFIMVAILYGMYSFTFWASELPILCLEAFFDGLTRIVLTVVPEGIVQSLIVSGMIGGVGGVLGFVPLIMFMFFAIAIMEDSGYMARVAYMLDRVLRWFGLHGNSVIALIVSGGISGGCAVPGVMATRVLRDPKERLATLLVIPFMNCGAKLPVYALLIGAFFSGDKARIMFILTLLSWLFALFAAKVLRATVLKGPKTSFVMELPPYRAPTLRGLLIHTWERTWQYIKKAGTVILALSVVLWAMMTFPGLSEKEIAGFEKTRKEMTETFLRSPEVKGLITSEKDIAALNEMVRAGVNGETPPELFPNNRDLAMVAQTASELKHGETDRQKRDERYLKAASHYRAFRGRIDYHDRLQQQTALKGTIAGWIGERLETITRPLGFEYRTNIALLGGFAAKEVVVSTLGTAYSLGEVDPEQTGSLSERLKNDPGWNPLQAFTLIVFTMLYVPCIATVISIRRETSWAWAGFSILFNLVAAYAVSLCIRQVGLALGF
ncbi:MAG: ferrous iron transport protein [Thermodesulfobacteriota bacterium]|nr:ferrous iron transport protein [Thermodesulfobacteriota bacterium]